MTSIRFLSGVAALALVMAAPSASFAAWKGAGGGGGGGVRVGGGAPAMGARMGGAPVANFARVGPSASFAAAGPRVVGPTTTATTAWTGGRPAWNGGWHGDRDFHHRRFFPGAFVAGAALGAYAAYGGPDYYYDNGPVYADDTYYDTGTYDDGATVAVVPVAPGGDASYCAQRYRSYDPASGTYLGVDGYRHPCP